MATKTKRPRKRKRAKTKLAGMDFQGLLDLRDQVDSALSRYRSTLEKQLAALGSSRTSGGRKITERHALAGRKVKPKYRDNAGNTWSGRGNQPRWLAAAIKEGKSLERFLIDKSAARGSGKVKKTKAKRAKKRRTKR
jgi:DNA-binding protein H-NS